MKVYRMFLPKGVWVTLIALIALAILWTLDAIQYEKELRRDVVWELGGAHTYDI